jgi:hypothetical protein
MSLAEIKEALRHLPAGDLADIERFAADLRRDAEGPSIRIVRPDDPDALAAENAVFEKHRELLRRLAQ